MKTTFVGNGLKDFGHLLRPKSMPAKVTDTRGIRGYQEVIWHQFSGKKLEGQFQFFLSGQFSIPTVRLTITLFCARIRATFLGGQLRALSDQEWIELDCLIFKHKTSKVNLSWFVFLRIFAVIYFSREARQQKWLIFEWRIIEG